jgi:predicted flap endonuclease-1-like 5' DNA nuclease
LQAAARYFLWLIGKIVFSQASISGKMRAVYILITFFLLLCVFFTRWYLCEVRSLCDLTPAMEILIMILVAFLVGFSGSWLVSEKTFLLVRGQLRRAEHNNAMLNEQLEIVEKECEDVRKHLAHWQHEVSILAERNKTTEPLLLRAQSQVSSLEDELQQYRRRYENLKGESDSIRETAEKLRAELAQVRSGTKTAKSPDQKSPSNVQAAVVTTRSRFTPSTWQTKNDLTKISGIGPVIQKRLNEIGIYSFQQISELTPEMIDRVAVAIKFFPDRIGRDNWIGQAAALMKSQKK